MHRATLCGAVALLSTSIFAIPASSPHVLHEKRDAMPPAWQMKHKAEQDAIVPVRIGLTQSNLENGHSLLMGVSDHKSERYGKHYTEEEINDIFAPSAESVHSVKGWLENAGVAKDRISQSFNKQWLQFDAKVAELEDLVKAKYHVYEHHTGKAHTACDQYHVPEHVQPHVDYITPGINFHNPSVVKRDLSLEKREDYKLPNLLKPLPMPIAQVKAQMANGNLALCGSIASPACIKAMYNITQGKHAAPGNKLGIFEDLNDHYSQADLNSFFASVYTQFPQGTHPELRGIDGAIGPVAVADAGPESDLDFQISYPIIHPQGSVLFQTDDQPTEKNYNYAGFLNNFLDAIDGSYCQYRAFGQGSPSPLDPQYPDPRPGGYKGQLQCGAYKPTNVISISYGGSELDFSINYQKRQCNEFMKLGMRGISVVVSSGDSGVAGGSMYPQEDGCYGRNGNIFNPAFPATCPYITVLGSTFLPAGADVTNDEEIATTRFPSGGGFSNIYPTADYQTSVVNNFLTKYPPPYNSYQTQNNQSVIGGTGRFNSAGRGYPDFAAVGDNVLIYNKGRPTLIGGTSASAPAFASILLRINEERIAAGKSTIGFVNPTLYAHPGVFHDITTGSNPGCNSDGFLAQPGWDPVTGLGTPNYPKMLDLFMGMP